MLKKIHQYLLTNHPLLWNIKLVPTLAISILINLSFLFIGYTKSNILFNSGYISYFYDAQYYSIFIFSFFTAILSFIIWLIFFSKNNAFKSFYPKNFKSLIAEWSLCFLIIISFCFYPISLSCGFVYNIRSLTSEKEAREALDIIHKCEILIPSTISYYFKEFPDDSYYTNSLQTPASYYTLQEIDSIVNLNITYLDYPNFTPLSLLNYKDNERSIHTSAIVQVKDWLKEGNEKQIKALMHSFFKLQKKHHLASTIDEDKWFSLVYNAPKFPVGSFNLIHCDNLDSKYWSQFRTTNYRLPYNELSSIYNQIAYAYEQNVINNEYLFLALNVAFILALLVLGFRSTSGKHWLLSFISISLISILIIIAAILMNEKFTFYILGLMLFCIEIILILIKIRSGSPKGMSRIYLNHIIMATYLILPFILFLKLEFEHTYDHESYLTSWIHENISLFFWFNLFFAFVLLCIFIKFILIKWKGLPED